MKQYLSLLAHTLNHGHKQKDRTGTGTISTFGAQLRFNLTTGFPLVTTRKITTKTLIHELLWFLAAETNVKPLNDHNVHIWDHWATPEGELGPIYGEQWRCWITPDRRIIDQIEQVISQIKTNPHSRRLIVSAWNPADLPDESISPQENVKLGRMALAPCHTLFQFHVSDNKLSCQLYQRSADIPIGLPYNIAQYALLTHLVALHTNTTPHELIWTGGDCHIYSNQVSLARQQLTRTPLPLPSLSITNKPPSIFHHSPSDFSITNYNHHPHISYPISI